MNKTFQELENDTREKTVIDIRKKADFDKETYPGAVHIFWEEFEEHLDEIPKDEPVYLFCYTGEKSGEIMRDLEELGYEAHSLDGGYREYLRIRLRELMAQMDEEEKTEPETDNTESGNLREQRCKDVERSIIKKFRRGIWRKFTKAINEYELIKDGDKIAVCISGGKDSMLMAKLFQELYRHGKQNFEVVYLVMNPGYNEVNYQTIMSNARLLNVPVTVFTTEIFDTVANITDSPCYLCARMRRGCLYSKAKELGCNKIALGHHFDDVIETILMGMLYGGQVQTMMPKLHSTNFEGMELIRPLYLVREEEIVHWMNYNDLHFIQCACRFTENCASCGGTEKGSKRAEIKELIRELAKKDPVIENNIFRSVENVNLKTILAYKENGVKHSFLDEYDEWADAKEQAVSLEKVRERIDKVDTQMKPLFLKRMECGRYVAEAKAATGGDVFVPERERSIIKNRASDVSADVSDEYVMFLRDLMSINRRYEYGLLPDMQEKVLSESLAAAGIDGNTGHSEVTVAFACSRETGDAGVHIHMAKLNHVAIRSMQLETDNERQIVTMTLSGNVNDQNMKQLLCQIGKESMDFRIVGVR